MGDYSVRSSQSLNRNGTRTLCVILTEVIVKNEQLRSGGISYRIVVIINVTLTKGMLWSNPKAIIFFKKLILYENYILSTINSLIFPKFASQILDV